MIERLLYPSLIIQFYLITKNFIIIICYPLNKIFTAFASPQCDSLAYALYSINKH